jgi:uncharacterized repeat protein (TIGR01451 family)
MKSSYAAIAAIVVIIVIIAGAVAIMRRGTDPSPTRFGVSVSISPSSQSGAKGATLTYTVTVHNTGNVSDNYSLVVSDNPSSLDPTPNWNPSVLPTSLTVSAGSSGTATLSVPVPLIAVGGAFDNITVTANGTGVSASKSCIAAVSLQENSVSIIDFAFQPSSITVSVGTTVIWTNTGGVTHNVTSTTDLFSSGNISPGGTFQFTFENAGTYNYTCTIHGFAGAVIVQ